MFTISVAALLELLIRIQDFPLSTLKCIVCIIVVNSLLLRYLRCGFVSQLLFVVEILRSLCGEYLFWSVKEMIGTRYKIGKCILVQVNFQKIE